MRNTKELLQSTFHGPPIVLPPTAAFLSAVGYSPRFVVFVSTISMGAILLVGIIHARARFTRAHAVLCLASICFLASVSVWHWPLRLSFLVARPSLESIARDAGRGVDTHLRNAGLFTTNSATVDSNGICHVSVSRRGSNCEFVRLPHPHGSGRQPEGVKLSDTWYLVGN